MRYSCIIFYIVFLCSFKLKQLVNAIKTNPRNVPRESSSNSLVATKICLLDQAHDKSNTSTIHFRHKRDSASILNLPGNDGESTATALYTKLALKKNSIPLHLVASTLSLSMIIAYFLKQKELFFIAFVAYLIEASFCSTSRYLSNVSTPAEVKAHVLELTMAEPVIHWVVECFHYVWRQTTNNQRSRRKVVTHLASRHYRFERFVL